MFEVPQRPPITFGEGWGLLPTHLIVDGARRALENQGKPCFIRQSGDRDRGSVVLVINHLNGSCSLWAQTRDLDGKLDWYAPKGQEPISESMAEEEIMKLRARDPDQWIVEVELPR